MLESLLFSLNAVVPLFVLTVLGMLLKKYKFVNEGFLSASDKVVFKLCLPCLLFIDVAGADISESLNVSLIAYCVIAVVLSFLIPCLVVPLFIKDNAKRGAFIQGMYRSNTAIIGITIATNLFGDEGSVVMAIVMPFVVTLFNVFAVIILSIYAPADVKLTRSQLMRRIAGTVATNPLIIAILLGIAWQMTGIKMPLFAERSLNYLADMTVPLALISLGASFTWESLRGRVGLTLIASVCKTVVVPAIATLCAIPLGFRGVELGVIFIQFGGPASVSSYIMAKQMKSDHELAGQILLVSTLMCVLTMFAGIFILRQTELI